MKFMAIVFTLFISINAYSICMQPDFAELYECTPMKSKSASKWCKDKYGEEFEAYLTDNNCSKSLGHKARDEEYTPTKRDLEGQVKAACMSFEQGEKLGCKLYNYDLARNYCNQNFGKHYIPFVPSATCSLEKAAQTRGEVNPKKLLDGLSSSIDELNSLITMIDQFETENSLGHIGKKGILIGDEFYTDSMKKILAYMKMTKNTFYKNSQLNIHVKKNKYIEQFIENAFQYSSLLSRIYKIYAYVAHKNTYVLKSYDFKNLESLNLVLKKEFALELLSKVNFKVKHINEDKDIEFIVSEQERQNLEYQAISKPNSKVEYAKLLTFMGSREVLTNHWAVQRLTEKEIKSENVRSCGKGFLSLRPKNNSMLDSNAYNDLWEYDVFVNNYDPRMKDIVNATWTVSILNDENAKKMIHTILKGHDSIKGQILNDLNDLSELNFEIQRISVEDIDDFKIAEDSYWENFSANHFKTIVLPADQILNKSAVIKRIINNAYKKRKEAIVERFLSMYPFMNDKDVKKLVSNVGAYIETKLQSSFKYRLGNALAPIFENYYDLSKRKENRKEKVNQTLETIKNTASAFAVEMELKKEVPNLKKLKIIQPHNMQELMLLFQSSLSPRLRATIKKDKEKALILENFFKSLNEKFTERFSKVTENEERVLAGTRLERERGLRQIGIELAKELNKAYPYHVEYKKLISGKEILVKGDATYVYRPFIKDNKIIHSGAKMLSNKEIEDILNGHENKSVEKDPIKEFKRLKKYQKDISKEHYVLKRDHTEVALPKIFYSEDIFKKIKKKNTGRNQDKVYTGEVFIKDSISNDDIKSITASLEKEQKITLDIILKKSQFFKNEKKQKKLNQFLGKDFSYAEPFNSIEETVHGLLTSLNLKGINNEIRQSAGYADKPQAQKALVSHYTTHAYQVSPILRANVYWKEKKTDHYYSYGSGRTTTTFVEKEGPLAQKIISSAFNKKTGTLNTELALKYINQAFDSSIQNASKKVSDFCKADYINYKNDSNFKKIFKSSRFLRANLKSPYGTSKSNYQNIVKFDEEITKDVRSDLEALNEDWLEPILIYSGTIALIALAVVFCVGTGGTGIPAAIVGVASLIGTVDMVISVPIIMASGYARIQTHFIETPAQLKFTKSLAHSQLGDSSIINWDSYREAKKEMKNAQMWQIGYMALDLFFVGSLGQHVKRATGTLAKKTASKAANLKLKGWGAPSSAMHPKITYTDFRKRFNFAKAAWKKVKHETYGLRLYQPKFQNISKDLIRTKVLREGLNKIAVELKIARRPWMLIDEMQTYVTKLKNRTAQFKVYSKAEKKMIEQVHGNITTGELFKFGRKYSTYSFVLESFKKAFKEKRLKSYFMNFGDELNVLRSKRGELLESRIKDVQLAIDKLEEVRYLKIGGHNKITGKNEFTKFLDKLTDKEIVALEEVVRKSSKKGILRKFKKGFKDYNNVVSGLANSSHFVQSSSRATRVIYPSGIFEDDVVSGYRFDNDAEDIVNYYNSIIEQNRIQSEGLSGFRNEMESMFSLKFYIDINGKWKLK